MALTSHPALLLQTRCQETQLCTALSPRHCRTPSPWAPSPSLPSPEHRGLCSLPASPTFAHSPVRASGSATRVPSAAVIPSQPRPCSRQCHQGPLGCCPQGQWPYRPAAMSPGMAALNPGVQSRWPLHRVDPWLVKAAWHPCRVCGLVPSAERVPALPAARGSPAGQPCPQGAVSEVCSVSPVLQLQSSSWRRSSEYN